MPRWDSFDAFVTEAGRVPESQRQQLVNELLREHTVWPWVEGTKATFIYSKLGTSSAALNLDTIKDDPPFAPMQNLEGTSLWYVTRQFAPDDLLDYMLAINDPMTPLATEPKIVERVSRFWRTDPLNGLRMSTAQMDVSVLRMDAARPFPDWSRMYKVQHGQVDERTLDSNQLSFSGRRLWIYTPPDYEDNDDEYPLLILQDGQWMTGPLQVPYIADALIKHGRMQPVVIAMIQSGNQDERTEEYISNNRHYAFVLTEMLPFIQTQYRIDATRLGIGGVAQGALAAAHAALNNPAVFNSLIMISAPLGGKGTSSKKIGAYRDRFTQAKVLPGRIFQSVGRYETPSRFYQPALMLRRILEERADVDYRFVEIGSGHGLVGFRSVFPEALAWAFPGM